MSDRPFTKILGATAHDAGPLLPLPAGGVGVRQRAVAFACGVLAALMLVVAAQTAAAEDTVKVALGQRGEWETAASELGQDAGMFRKRGLALELHYTNGDAETLQAVVSGSADIGVGLATTWSWRPI